MSKSTTLIRLMEEDLPSLGYQKRLSYRATIDEVHELFTIINKDIFRNKLHQPDLRIMNKAPGYWGYCIAKQFTPLENESVCIIKLAEKWYCRQWLITTLAHEMVHQYQFEVDGLKRIRLGLDPIMSHGPSFFAFRKKLQKNGISLKKSHSRKRWLVNQDLFKC